MATMTRRLSVSDGGRPSLSKMLATCFSVDMGRRHAHVDDGHVGPVLLDGLPQRISVGHRGHHVEAAPGQGLGQPRRA